MEKRKKYSLKMLFVLFGLLCICLLPGSFAKAAETVDITPTVSFPSVENEALVVGDKYSLAYEIDDLYGIPVEAQLTFVSETPETVYYSGNQTDFTIVDAGEGRISYQVTIAESTMTLLQEKFSDADLVQNDAQPVIVFSGNYVPKDVYRLYNSTSGEHFYTASVEERDFLVTIGWQYEGTLDSVEYSRYSVFRLYNPTSGNHLFTGSWDEMLFLAGEPGGLGWIYEGIGFYTSKPSNAPVYRLYNPHTANGMHFYTGSTTEREGLVALGWQAEGIAWYDVER